MECYILKRLNYNKPPLSPTLFAGLIATSDT